MKNIIRNLFMLGCLLVPSSVCAQKEYREVERFHATYANQGVAVDGKHFYAIQNNHISKYTLQGDSVTTWTEPNKERIRHINSGIVIGNKLYCAHSNFPKIPMASSIEVFDTKTMKPIESISLGHEIGSCTWAVPGKNCWYVFFAHYDGKGEQGKDASWSQLVQFDKKWRRQRGWILPKELIEDIRPNSLSGGVLVDDTFYCTGHDNGKCYLLKLPSQGMTLEWIGTLKVPFDGQAFSRDKDGNFWGIIRKDKMVLKAAPIE